MESRLLLSAQTEETAAPDAEDIHQGEHQDNLREEKRYKHQRTWVVDQPFLRLTFSREAPRTITTFLQR